MERFEAEYAGRLRFGQRVEVDPTTGLLDVVAKTAGFAAYVEQQLREAAGVDSDVPLTEKGIDGLDVPRTLVELWLRSQRQLAAVCKMAIDAGIQQQQLDLVRSYQDRVLDLVEGVLRDLGHDPDSISTSAVVMRRLALATAPAPDPP